MSHLSAIFVIVAAIIPLIFAISCHEAAHGLVADYFGDSTAKELGRLTLNPIHHIDLIGTIIVPIAMLLFSGFIFGWAKPVPINSKHLKNPVRDMAWIALAGPLSNIIMLCCWAVLLKILSLYGIEFSQNLFLKLLWIMCLYGIYINAILAILNLIPIPPLDGSRVLSAFLPKKIAHYFNQIENYGIFLIIALLILFAPYTRHGLQWLSSLIQHLIQS